MEKWTATFDCTVSGGVEGETKTKSTFQIPNYSIVIAEIPGTSRKSSPSNLDTNEVIGGKPHYTPTTFSSSSTSFDEDDYKTSEENGHEDEEEYIDGTDGDSQFHLVTKGNPISTTSNGGTRQVSLVGIGRQPAEFVDSELIPHSSATVNCPLFRSVAVKVVLILISGQLLLICPRISDR